MHGDQLCPVPCSAYPPCAVERQRFPLATERGRSILHPYSIVIASLLDMITGNKPGSRQHRPGIERPKWVVECRPLQLHGTAVGLGRLVEGVAEGSDHARMGRGESND